MKKTFTLLAAISLCASANADSLKMLSFGLGIPGYDEPQMMGLGISPDGNYVCGPIEMGMGYFVGNIETDEYYFVISEDDEGAELRHVDNNGVAIGYNGPGITYSFDTQEETVLNTPEGDWKYVLGEALTNDGSVMVGSLVAKGYATYAAFSKDGGEWTLLPMPSDEELGRYAGEGSTAKYVSGDGKYILGSVGNNMGPATMWILNDAGEYEVDPIYTRFVVMTEEELEAGEKTLLGMSPIGISDNGKYVLCNGTIEFGEGYALVPVVYNTEEDSIVIYDEPQDIDTNEMGLYASAIDNNGSFVGIIGEQPLYASVGCFIMKAGETQAESLSEAFPAYGEAFAFSESIGYVIPTAMSADGSKILGYGFYSEDFYDEDAPAYFATFVIETGNGSSIDSVASSMATPEAIFSIDGHKLQEMNKGINIVRMSDGSVKKIFKK